jgi:Generalcontrol nonderepressible 1 (Gcn1) N-terminal
MGCDSARRVYRKFLGLTLIFCAVESHYAQIRRDAIRTLIDLVHANPALTNDVVIYGLEEYISRSTFAGEGSNNRTRYQQQLLHVLSSSSAFAKDAKPGIKESLLMRSVILAHHPLIGSLGHHWRSYYCITDGWLR